MKQRSIQESSWSLRGESRDELENVRDFEQWALVISLIDFCWFGTPGIIIKKVDSEEARQYTKIHADKILLSDEWKHIVWNSIWKKENQASDNVGKFHTYLKCRIWIHHQKCFFFFHIEFRTMWKSSEPLYWIYWIQHFKMFHGISFICSKFKSSEYNCDQ